MATCPRSGDCVFNQTVEPSIIKRVRYASAYTYCRGGRHAECALYSRIAAAQAVPENLMPDGSTGDYLDDERAVSRRFLVIEDSPVFAALAGSTVANNFPGAEIVRRASFDDAEPDLRDGSFSAIVCGYGLGNDKTVHDVRRATAAPIVILTGRLGTLDAPRGARIVAKSAGPEALAEAIRASLR